MEINLMRKKIIAANWKMHMSNMAAVDFVSKMRAELEKVSGIEIVLFPPHTALSVVTDMLRNSPIKIGAQNVHMESVGAFTGEISMDMLKDICSYVIVGHSERRNLFGETNEMISRKVKAVVDSSLNPILCVGERLEERENGTEKFVVEQQIRHGLDRLEGANGVTIAYEPIWAIGTGKAATTEDAQNMMAHIRATVALRFGKDSADSIPILYGGSVNADNVVSFVGSPDVDGALVGSASLDNTTFVTLVTNAATILT
jgi:triosephosphate isomerase